MYIYIRFRKEKMWHKNYIKWSLIGLISDFSFSETGFHTKVEKPSLP